MATDPGFDSFKDKLHPKTLNHTDVLRNAQAWFMVLDIGHMMQVRQSTTDPDGFTVQYNFGHSVSEIDVGFTMKDMPVHKNGKLPPVTGAGVIVLMWALRAVADAKPGHLPLVLTERFVTDRLTDCAAKIVLDSMALREAMQLCGSPKNPFDNGAVPPF